MLEPPVIFFVCVCLCARVWVCVEEGNVCETHREKVFKREAVSHLLYKDINTWGLKKKGKMESFISKIIQEGLLTSVRKREKFWKCCVE